MPTDAELRAVRQAIYRAIVDTAVAPRPADVAAGCGISIERADAAFRALADAHVVVLRQSPSSSTELWAAPPFAADETGFRVDANGKSWFGVCAWDAFGVPAALHADARIRAACAWSGEPIECGVRDGAAFGTAVVHLLVPAARFWDDIFYT